MPTRRCAAIQSGQARVCRLERGPGRRLAGVSAYSTRMRASAAGAARIRAAASTPRCDPKADCRGYVWCPGLGSRPDAMSVSQRAGHELIVTGGVEQPAGKSEEHTSEL